jgi:hypothetical protein
MAIKYNQKKDRDYCPVCNLPIDPRSFFVMCCSTIIICKPCRKWLDNGLDGYPCIIHNMQPKTQITFRGNDGT